MKRIIMIITVLLTMVAAGIAAADDTTIYGSTAVSVEPNVLIIFDTSGSMSTNDVPGEYYNPSTTYSGTKTTNAVYQKVCGWSCSYNVFATDISLIACPDAKTTLQTNGRVSDEVRDSSSGFTCGGTEKDLYMGNWINYDTSVSSTRKRIDVAKDVIKKLIDDTDNVRFGLMRFNNSQGGRIIRNIGPTTDAADKTAFKVQVDALTADGWTPLAETTAEAGLYFAGKASWFNSGVTYTSPVQYRCQKNYIILMTDGDPTEDDDSKLRTGSYINGDNIADQDGDGSSGKLDDVSYYLFQEDILPPPMGVAGESFERQNIVTYTIGFLSQQDLLGETALNGGGKYYTAASTSGLEAAFQEIVSEISEVNAVFVSPVVPVSRMNRTFAGNSLYVGFFKPQATGRWAGNIKKYGLDAAGALIDANGILATLSDGAIKDNAQSYWSFVADGPDVLKGGIGGVLLDQASRNLYSYLVTGTTALTNSVNAFSLANTTNLTAAKLGVLTSTDRDSIINDTIGASRAWILGDVLHSQPAVVHYDTNADGILDDAYIYAGANDGMMHAFRDSSGAEAWGFIPPEQLDRLKLFIDTTPSHDYYIDGAPVVYESASQKILFFGERRGGYTYHALDITAPAAPDWLYKIEPDHLVNIDGDNNGSVDGVNATLGQSWGTPAKGKIKTSASTSETVFILGGGYDVNQDKKAPPPTGTETINPRAATDTVGRAIFSVNVATGVPSKLNVNAGNNAAMTHCITDVSVFDNNANGYINRVYAGDLGGNIFALEDDNGDGTWTSRKLFYASHDDGIAGNHIDDGVQKKIMYGPDTTLELFGDMVFVGTGDRADPEETSVENRLYAIKNEWTDIATFTTLTESDLVDVTDNLLVLGNESERLAAQEALANSKGWYIRLENLGEKITAGVTVFAGVVYFTTYTPEASGPPPSDPCTAAAGRGQARLYAVNYLTGGAVYDWSSTPEFTGDTTPVEVPMGKRDRSKLIGTSIPSAPVIAVLPGGAKMYIGVEGGVTKQDPTAVTDVNAYYWRQLN